MDDIPPNVPEIFKEVLCWPKQTKTPKKRSSKIKIPSVATSAMWQQYHVDKENNKHQQQTEVEERRKQRKEAAEIKKRKIEEMRAQKIIKKTEQAALKAQKQALKSRKKNNS